MDTRVNSYSDLENGKPENERYSEYSLTSFKLKDGSVDGVDSQSSEASENRPGHFVARRSRLEQIDCQC